MEQVRSDPHETTTIDALTGQFIGLIEEFKMESDQEEEIKEQSTAPTTQTNSNAHTHRKKQDLGITELPKTISDLKIGDVLEVKNYLGAWHLGIVVD